MMSTSSNQDDFFLFSSFRFFLQNTLTKITYTIRYFRLSLMLTKFTNTVRQGGIPVRMSGESERILQHQLQVLPGHHQHLYWIFILLVNKVWIHAATSAALRDFGSQTPF